MNQISKLSLFAVIPLSIAVIAYYVIYSNTPEPIKNKSETQFEITESPKEAEYTQIPGRSSVTLAGESKSKWWETATVYQVWVRSFFDSDGDGNGDLKGIKEKMDYFKMLGVDAIWLSPIFESPSYHGYDAQDYYAIEKDYGSMEDFEALISEAKSRNIRIVLDLVLNHISEEHPWFLKALENDETYRDYFIWSESIPENFGKAWGDKIEPTAVWHRKPNNDNYYYAAFGWTQPDLNFRNPEVVQTAHDIAEFWLNKGVDGFRLDAIRYLVEDEGITGQADTSETIVFWQEFSKKVRATNPDAMLVGEALTNRATISRYYNAGQGITQAFDFDFTYFIESLYPPSDEKEKNDNTTQNWQPLIEGLSQSMLDRFNTKGIPYHYFASFLNNHDLNRINRSFGMDTTKNKVAASLLMLQPGAVFMYYGDEIGMGQYLPNKDVYRRSIMQWNSDDFAGFNTTGKRWLDDASWFFWEQNYTPWWTAHWEQLGQKTVFNVSIQQENEDSILNHYQRLIALRKKDRVIASPNQIDFFDTQSSIFAARYVKDEEFRVALINLDTVNSATIDLPIEFYQEYFDHYTNEEYRLEQNNSLLPGEIKILSKKI